MSTIQEQSRLVDSKEVGKALGLHERVVRNLALEGKIPSYRIGRNWRFDLAEILQVCRKETK